MLTPPPRIRVANAAVATVLALFGCGLRSAPNYDAEVPLLDLGGSDFDRGTCAEPIALPTITRSVQGELAGESLVSVGECAQRGPDDVYLLRPASDTDVFITFTDPEIDARLRVSEATCDRAGTVDTLVCVDAKANDVRTFHARAGFAYYVVVDGKDEDDGGRYAFDVEYSDDLAACGVHPELISQGSSGATFRWTNEFSAGRGRVDGECGGHGKENMFRLVASRAGWAFIQARRLSGRFEPVVNVRTGCGASTELECRAALPGQAFVALEYFIPRAGTYYVVVDSNSIEAGGYELEVQFE